MKIEAPVLAAVIAGSATILGGLLINFYIRRNEDKTKRLQIKLEFLNKQIEELYGPLYSLIQLIINYWDVQQKIISREGLSLESKEQIIKFFRERYFFPLHNQIRKLIKNKFNLIEGIELPKSFWIYLQHSTLETTQITILKELNIDTQHLKEIPWPKEFEKDIKQTLDLLMLNYNKLLQEI